MRERISPSGVARPAGAYHHVVKYSGKTLVFVAGQVGRTLEGKMAGVAEGAGGSGPEIAKIDLEAQVRQTWRNIQACLNSAGADFKDLVRVNTYVVVSAFNEYRRVASPIRREFMGDQLPPGATICVMALMHPEALIEVETVAALDG